MEAARKGILFVLLCWQVVSTHSNTEGKPSICYDFYGCFSNEYPFNRTSVPLPESPLSIQTRFLLFTRTTAWRGEWVSLNNIMTSQFNASRNTILVIHGFAGFTVKRSITQERDWWGIPMKNQLLRRSDVNVVVIDWMRGAWFPFTRAVGNARLVGSQGAHFLQTIEEMYGRRLPFIHIIGFSFGAHVAGYIGRRMREIGRTVDRITGLDPAAMWFDGEHNDVSLDSSDAMFVDVIHTSATYGITSPIGHVDFYPNGGHKQPGCDSMFAGFTKYLFCSHNKAPEFFTSSITSSCQLYAYHCNNELDFKNGKCLQCNGSCMPMGYDANIAGNGTVLGKYYLLTQDKAPYCEYHYEIRFKTMNSWFAGVYGPVSVKIKARDGRYHIMKSMKYIPGCTEVKYLYTSPFNLGPLKRITVWHHGIFQSWGLERVIVRPAWTQERYVAHPNTWIRYGVRVSKHLLTWEKDLKRKRRLARKIALRNRKHKN